MIAAVWEPFLVSALLLTTVVIAAAGVSGFLVWRSARRRWHAFRHHGLVVGGLALWEVTSSAWSSAQWRSHSAPTPDVETLTPRHLRRALRRAVDDAAAAVQVAAEAGAATASLPDLCGQLRDAASELDGVLRIQAAGSVPRDVATQARQIMSAAADVRRAALASASDVTGYRVRNLVRDTDREVRCLDAGLAAARRIVPHPDR